MGRWFLQIVDLGNFNMRLEILKSAPLLLVKWEVVSPNCRYVHVGNFNIKLTGRSLRFPQIVDRDSGNLYTIYIKPKLWC